MDKEHTPEERDISQALPKRYCDLLDNMRTQPQDNWKIQDIEKLCSKAGLTCTPPSGGGSHYKVSSPFLSKIITVPAKSNIKAIYVKRVIELVDVHLEQCVRENKND